MALLVGVVALMFSQEGELMVVQCRSRFFARGIVERTRSPE